jgi:hypothetical protein
VTFRSLTLAALALLAAPAAASAAGELTITSTLHVEAPKGFYTGQPLRFSFSVRNQTSSPVSTRAISVPVRGVDPAVPIDTLCTNGLDVTVPAGGTFDCDAPRPGGYPAAGGYTYWADWWGFPDVWHHGELGPDQTFTLAAPPQTSLSGTGQWIVGDQTVGGVRDTVITLTNTGSAIALIDAGASFGGVNPGDFSLVGDTCTPAPIQPNATCAFVVRFTPATVGARAATLNFTANTSPGANVINLAGAGVAPVVVAPSQLNVTVSYDFSRATHRSTRFTRLTVKGVPKGATVRVTCAKGCSRRSLTSTHAGNVSLKAFVKRAVKARSKIAVKVTRPGALGVIKTLTVRAGKRPTLATTCLSLEGTKTSCVR